MKYYTDWEKYLRASQFVRSKTLDFFFSIENWEIPNAFEQRKDKVCARHQEVNRDLNK